MRPARPSGSLLQHSRQYATKGSGRRASHDKRRMILLFSSSGAAVATGATVLGFKDELVKSYEAAERSGRVVAALGVCVNE